MSVSVALLVVSLAAAPHELAAWSTVNIPADLAGRRTPAVSTSP